MNRIYSLAALTLILASCSHKKDDTATDAVPQVDVCKVVTDSVTLYKEYPGTLSANRTASVYCRVDGYVSSPRYTAGDYVRQGEILFTVEAPDLKNAVDEAEAALATAISQNDYAEQHYLAVAKAYESQAVSKMEVAEALSSRDQSRASVSSARASLADARQKLGYCTITAPFSGHISINERSGGSYVNGGADPVPLATIYDDAQVIAEFSIEDDSFMRMFENPNNRHLINYSAVPVVFSEKLPHSYTANLDYLAPNINPSTGTMLLNGTIDNKYHELRAGMYCTIRMPYKVDPAAMLVRDASIATDQLGKYVYLVSDSDKVVYTPIKTGDLVADTMRLVTEGLRPGDRYVTSALLKVRDGMTVKPLLKN